MKHRDAINDNHEQLKRVRILGRVTADSFEAAPAIVPVPVKFIEEAKRGREAVVD